MEWKNSALARDPPGSRAGGTSLTGGEGGVIRSASGALLVAMIVKGFEIIGAQFWDQMIVTGVLVALGSALGNWLTRRRLRQSNRDDLTNLSDQTSDGHQGIVERMPIDRASVQLRPPAG